MLADLLSNQVLIGGLVAWSLAQLLKPPISYLATRRWDWRLIFAPGGMPSSHSALVTASSLAIGLFVGFDTALFALSVVVAMVVIYDATGVRRQAGKHAEVINVLIHDLAAGHPLKEAQLGEVLGHTPTQAFFGILLGLVVTIIEYLLWV
jgi:acid phosphatase family membrane protein YuiD